MKKHYFLFVLIAILILLTGCGNNVSSEGIDIVINVEREGNFLTSSGEMEVLIDKEILFTIDGTSSGSAKVNLREGKHIIQVKAQGDKSEKLEFDVSKDGDRRFYFTAEVGNFFGVELVLRDDIPDELKKEYIISQQKPFHDDVAWIIFSDIDDIEYLGCIDKKGELLFKYNIESIEQYAHFSNGYAYLFTDEKVLVIDKTGTILSSHPLNRENYWLCENACADGYIVTKEYVGDFESSKHEYKIFNPAGEVIATYIKNYIDYNWDDMSEEEYIATLESLEPLALESYINVLYCGDGVFQFINDTEERYSKPCKYYFVNTDTWLDVEQSNITKMNNGFGISGIRTKMERVYDESISEMIEIYTSYISYIDETGMYIEFPIDEFSIEKDFVTISNQKCIIPSWKKGISIYDLETGNKIIDMPEKYVEKIDWGNIKIFTVSEDKIAIPMKGADNKSYIILFDFDFNELETPYSIIAYWKYEDGTLMLETDDEYIIYDKNLDKVNTTTDGDVVYGTYSDGVSLVLYEYITLDGKILFEELDMENATLIELSEYL